MTSSWQESAPPIIPDVFVTYEDLTEMNRA